MRLIFETYYKSLKFNLKFNKTSEVEVLMMDIFLNKTK